MTTDMHATGEQQGTIAGHPTGFRRLTVASMATESLARDFEGFGDNGLKPMQILGAFKAAAPFLGYGAKIVHAIDWFFRFTAPQDWRAGARPIVWPSARMQQEELQLSVTRTKALNRLLIELGFVVAKDSPNGKRYGQRDRQGNIVEVYGFDLSPLAQRFEEFERVAQEGRAVRARMGRLRRRATIARKGIAQIFDAAAEYGFVDATWQALSAEARVLSTALRRVDRVEEMEIGVAGLERRLGEAQARFETQLAEQQKDVDKDREGANSGPHIYTYKSPLNLNPDTVIAYEGSSSGVGATPELNSEPQKPEERQERDRVLRMYPGELPVLAPRLRGYLVPAIPNGPTSWTRPTDCATNSTYRGRSGPKRAKRWAAKWPPLRSPSSRPRTRTTSRALRGITSTAWCSVPSAAS